MAAAQFWTEHSARATLPSWAAAVGVAKEDIDLLGRWQSDVSAGYVRTHRFRVEQVQQRVATALRGMLGSYDLVDEASLFANLRAHLLQAGVEEAAATKQLDLLQWASPSADEPPLRCPR